jgi:hypothetical protein
MSKPAVVIESVQPAKQATAPKGSTFGFGAGPRARRKIMTVKGGPSDQDLIAAFIAKKGVTSCPTMFAEGAVDESGYYRW